MSGVGAKPPIQRNWVSVVFNSASTRIDDTASPGIAAKSPKSTQRPQARPTTIHRPAPPIDMVSAVARSAPYSATRGRINTTLKDAMRLSPYYPDWFLKELGRAYFQIGRFDEAVASLELRHRRSTTDADSQILLAASYAATGKGDEARTTLSAFLEKRPYYTVKHYADGEFYRDPDHLKGVLDALRKAGLPE